MSLPCKMLAALFAGVGAGLFAEWFVSENVESDRARNNQLRDIPDPADEFGPPLEDVVATELLARASGEASLAGESVVAAAERICRCEAPTGEFDAVDPWDGWERFKGPEDIA
jgi:hypothetical protein